MKIKLISLLFAAAVLPAAASVTIQTQFGTAFTSSSATVATGTKWALVVDANNDGLFYGGFSTASSLNSAGANLVFTTGQVISLGSTLGSDRVFALGTFNGAGPGITDGPVNLSLGVNGVATGLKYAFYWFPGATGTTSITVGSQVGGLSRAVAEAGLGAMVIPADGANVPQGAANSDASGTVPNSSFTAVNLNAVPEPSAVLLGAIGALGLLRRRRN